MIHPKICQSGTESSASKRSSSARPSRLRWLSAKAAKIRSNSRKPRLCARNKAFFRRTSMSVSCVMVDVYSDSATCCHGFENRQSVTLATIWHFSVSRLSAFRRDPLVPLPLRSAGKKARGGKREAVWYSGADEARDSESALRRYDRPAGRWAKGGEISCDSARHGTVGTARRGLGISPANKHCRSQLSSIAERSRSRTDRHCHRKHSRISTAPIAATAISGTGRRR